MPPVVLMLRHRVLTPDQVPEAFRQLRPWVHHGWEMVLLAAELPVLKPEAWLAAYDVEQGTALQRRGWTAGAAAGGPG